MSKHDDLLALAELCEKATGPDRELEEAIYAALGYCNHERTERYVCQSDSGFTCIDCGKDTYGADRAPRYTASIDAAMTLLPEGWRYLWDGINGVLKLCKPPQLFNHGWTLVTAANHRTEALALTAACLKALASQESPQ